MFLDKIKNFLASKHTLETADIEVLKKLIADAEPIDNTLKEHTFFREVFRLVFRYTQETLFIVDFSGKFVYAPALWLRLSGISAKELSKQNVMDYVHSEDMLILENVLEQLNKNFKTIKDIQLRLKTMSGDYHWHNVNCIPSKKLKHYEDVILIIAKDVTEEMAIEEQLLNAQETEQLLDRSLKESREELHIYQEQLETQQFNERLLRKENAKNTAILTSIMNACDTQIFSVNTHFQLISCNHHFAESVKSYLNKKIEYKVSIFEITTNNNRKALKSSLKRAMKGEEFSEFYSIEHQEKIYKRKVLFTPMKAKDGGLLGVTVVAIDVSDH